MKLDRNTNPDGKGKYALLLLRHITRDSPEDVRAAVKLLKSKGLLDFGDINETEFFVIRLKDIGAAPALWAYTFEYLGHDREWASEIFALADKARNMIAKYTAT